MLSESQARAERYEKEAARVRQEAECATNQNTRDTLLTIARQYGNLAKPVRQVGGGA